MRRRNFIPATGLSLLGANRLLSQIPASLEITKKKRYQTIKTKVLIVGGGPAGIGAVTRISESGCRNITY